jgi:alkanesulfonate monooxygenase SsuD/methylene tetrahydromethanopterin reductase-like flavin-dependent oxidoreductase (luciferase family)
VSRFKLERGPSLGASHNPDAQLGAKPAEPTWASLRDQVREAEALGYDTVVAVETKHDPWLVLAIAAQEPSKLQPAPGIALS